MSIGNWMALLRRQSGAHEPITWNEIVVGHDFGFIKPHEIQSWVRCHGFHGEACERLLNLSDAGLERFEEALWEACRECTGKLPRPGGSRWSGAQDRWRLALIQDALQADLTSEALAIILESIWERVGCPEDMVGLWHTGAPWEKRKATVDYEALHNFLNKRQKDDGALVSA